MINATLKTGPDLTNAGRINMIDGVINGDVNLVDDGVLNTLGDVIFNGSMSGRAGSVTVSDGTATLAAGGDKLAAVETVSTGDGTFDVKDNKLILAGASIGSRAGSTYTGVTGQIQSGRGDGSWNGVSGIVTSMSEASGGVLTTLAVATADETGYVGGTFGGASVASGDVLVMYTWGGDADLNGRLDGDDYFYIDSRIVPKGEAFGFHNGDFNYDGIIDGDDYFIIDSNILYAQASGIVFPTSGGGGFAPVPEPSAILLTPALLLLRHRR